MTQPLDSAATLALEERQWLPRFSLPTLGFTLYLSGVPADPDASVVTVARYNSDQALLDTRTATRTAAGVYQITFGTADTATPGYYALRWSYNLSGVANHTDTYVEVGQAAPDYEALPADMQLIVEQVWVRFADVYDSALGGPNLQTYVQSNFGRNRVAQLLGTAVRRLAVIAQPYQTFSVDGVGAPKFPVAQWGGLAEQATYIEVLKHLRRSYVEQPSISNDSLSRTDRRDYMNRWGEIISSEEQDLKSMQDTFKISMMGLGSPRVTVAGGVYGTFAPTRLGSNAGRPRFWARYYA